MKFLRDKIAIITLAAFVFSISLGAPMAWADAPASGTFVQGNVSGVARDASGNPMSGQTVQILDANGNTVLTTTTGSNGGFSLNTLGAGNYTMVVGNVTTTISVVTGAAAAGAATSFAVTLGGAGGGAAVGTWALVGGALVLTGGAAAAVVNNNNKDKCVSGVCS